MSLGPTELLIILAIVLVLFGASRLRGLGGALGGSIREFKSAVSDDKKDEEKKPEAPTIRRTDEDDKKL